MTGTGSRDYIQQEDKTKGTQVKSVSVQEKTVGVQEKTRLLILQAQQGNEEARTCLIQENLGLVWSIVHRFSNRGCEMEDLFQLGCIGLFKAIERFDLSFDVKFSTYAVPMISGEIRRFLRDDGAIKISRSIKENYWKIQHAKHALQSKSDQEITISQIGEATGLSCDEILLALDAPIEVESLNKPMVGMEGREVTLEERIADQVDEKELVDNRIILEESLARLDGKARQLIHMRYFQDCTQSVVAKRLNMTQVQVSRLEKKILQSLREQIQM